MKPELNSTELETITLTLGNCVDEMQHWLKNNEDAACVVNAAVIYRMLELKDIINKLRTIQGQTEGD